MDIIELVLDYLFNIDDVIPFLSVSHAAKFFAERRVCEIVLDASRSPGASYLQVMMTRRHYYKGRSINFPTSKYFAMVREVVLSHAHGWRVRFDCSNTIWVSSGSNVLDLVIETNRRPSREFRMFRDFDESNIDLCGFMLHGLWRIDQSVCGRFIRDFGSQLSIAYEVYEPSDSDYERWQKELDVMRKSPSDISTAGRKWREDVLSQRDRNLRCRYHFCYFDISVSLFLDVWRDWKAPLSLCKQYPHRHSLGITTGPGIQRDRGSLWQEYCDMYLRQYSSIEVEVLRGSKNT